MIPDRGVMHPAALTFFSRRGFNPYTQPLQFLAFKNVFKRFGIRQYARRKIRCFVVIHLSYRARDFSPINTYSRLQTPVLEQQKTVGRHD